MFFRNQSTMNDNDAQQNSTPDISQEDVQQVVIDLRKQEERVHKMLSIRPDDQNKSGMLAISNCCSRVIESAKTLHSPTVSDTNENHASPINRL